MSTTTILVHVNGSPTNGFKMETRLCQSNPFSPFLFLLGIEGLNVMLSAIVEVGLYVGYKVG